MRTFQNAPVRQKLLLIITVITALALSVAGVGIVLVDSALFRGSMQRDLLTLANIVSDNSTAALTFNDARAATETLSSLRERPHLVLACLFRSDGSVFARYRRSSGVDCRLPGPGQRVESTPAGLLLNDPILLNGQRLGSLVLLYDRGELVERTTFYTAIVLVILVFSTLVAILVSARLRGIITTPILRLAHAAASVTESGDYGIRVEKDSGDELGLLVDAFNKMLSRIQLRDLEVQNARNSLETTLTSIGDAVISTDAKGLIVFANPVAQSLTGWSKPDIIGCPVDEVFRIVHEFTRQTVESPVQRVLRQGTIIGLANRTTLIARDGTEIPIDDSAAPIKQDGKILGVVLVFRDITERRRAQQDAAYLAAIVESSDDAIIGKSPEGVIHAWNIGAERLYGYKPEEVVGRPMMELVPPDRRHEESNILEQLRSGNRVVHFETVRVRKDGAPIEVSLTISPIRDRAGQVVGISHVARDITDQKRTAEQIRQTQKLESLGVLAGGIAHDFNNLLTGILGNASIALDEIPAHNPVRAPIAAVVAASERAAQLTRQMLAYSGKGRFIIENIDLSERVRDILPLIRSAIPAPVELRLHLDDHLPPIEADSAQMQQLVMNVIINGAEAVPEGANGILTITTRQQQVDNEYLEAHGGNSAGELTPGPHVVFQVSDTGCGMDESTLARIFDPFFTTKFTGRGLGLAAVLGIVRGHRGSIEVSSSLGHGTTFRFLFPTSETAIESKRGAPKPRLSELRAVGAVLVVDDEQIVRVMAKQALERSGYKVLLAEDGARALDIFRREAHHIGCVILDLTMPVMSGEETLAHMKTVRSQVPVILSSGFSETQAIERFRGKNLAGFLQKPYKSSDLVEKVSQVIGVAGENGNPAE